MNSDKPVVPDYVDITRDNFEEVFPMVESALKDCSFYAIDCEMTGLFLNDNKEEFLDDYQDRYSKMTNSAHNFVINQFGLSVFKPVEDGSCRSYTASTFNFYVFPHPCDGDNNNNTKKFMSDAGALSFLASQNFDFNKWIYKGVPFLNMKEREFRMRQLRQDGPRTRNEVVPTKEDDIRFVKDVIDQVKVWLAADEPKLLLNQVTSYQRLLSYQELSKPQFGIEGRTGFFVEKVQIAGWTRLQLVRGSEEEVAKMQEEDKKIRLQALNDASGFTRVFELMKHSNKPAVGHNCMFDILYSLAAFAEPKLPEQWDDFKLLVGKWFPAGLYDTKHLARNLPELFDNMGVGTSLGDVYKGLSKDGPQLEAAKKLVAELKASTKEPACLPEIKHAPGFEKYKEMEAGGAAHEAGYDAFMTGSAFANLMPLIHAKGALPGAQEAAMARDTTEGNGLETGDEPPASGGLDWGMGVYNPWEYVKRYLGRLNIGKSDMAYISLYSPDPPLIRPNVFYLSGLPPGTRVFDVIRRCQAADLGRVRVTMLSPTTAYIEVEAAVAAHVVKNLSGDSGTSAMLSDAGDVWNTTPLQVLTFEECAKQKARDAREASVPKGVQTGSKGGDTVLGARPSKRMRPEGGGGDPNGEAPNNCYKCNVM